LTRKLPLPPVLALGASLTAFLAAHADMFRRVAGMCFLPSAEDMSFVWIVPVVSLYALWRMRAGLAEALSAARFSWSGLVASAPFVVCGLLGARGLQIRFEILSFAGLCVTMPWTFFGWRFARQLLFPAAYLLFLMPLSTFFDFSTIHLRYLASGTALAVLKAFGVDAVREGTAVLARGAHPFAIDVAEPCSGLRSLFALMALTAAYAYFTQRTWPKRVLLFLSSVPLAVLGNVARILSICLVASFCSAEFATGFYHDYSGFVVFAVALSAMVAVGEVLAKGGGAGSANPQFGTNCSTVGRRVVATWRCFVAAAFFVGAFAFQCATPEARVCAAPAVALGDKAGYAATDEPVGEAEKNILPPDTAVSRKRYDADSGESFLQTLVVGGVQRASIHRPELCLPAQGYRMSSPRNATVAGRDWHLVDFDGKGAHGTLAYTFFNQSGYRTASHVARIFRDVFDRTVLNRVDRWVMCTVAGPRDDARFAAFLASAGKDLE